MTPNPKSANRGATVLWVGVLAVVVVLGVVAVVLARGKGDDKPPIEDETSAITVTGDPLPAQTSTEDPAIGETIPTVSGTAVDGTPITIEPDGKAKVIVFMAHWCPHCQREIPLLAEHLAETGLPDDVEIIGVATNTATNLDNYPPTSWLDRVGWDVPTLLDSPESEAYATFGMSSFPSFLVVDADGKVVVRTSGELPVETFDQLVEAARSGQVE
ncbi:MAG: TlpA family protein disulfide reductase [Actinobacteria bacterium]|nr:TlpA family protein disulfide reductase [Actinomycetota bacterium]